MSGTKAEEVVALKLKHVCDRCSRTFPTLRGLRIHVSRWCDGGQTQRSRRGSKADRAVKAGKKRAAEARLDQVHVGTTALENVHSFEYLGAKLQCDGSDEADVLHRMAIAQTTFGSLSNIWADHRLSRALKLRTSIGSVLHIDAFFRGMDVDCCSDAQYQRLQQPMPACHHWPGLSAHSHSPSVRPGACDPTAEIAISRAHPAHA